MNVRPLHPELLAKIRADEDLDDDELLWASEFFEDLATRLEVLGKEFSLALIPVQQISRELQGRMLHRKGN